MVSSLGEDSAAALRKAAERMEEACEKKALAQAAALFPQLEEQFALFKKGIEELEKLR